MRTLAYLTLLCAFLLLLHSTLAQQHDSDADVPDIPDSDLDSTDHDIPYTTHDEPHGTDATVYSSTGAAGEDGDTDDTAAEMESSSESAADTMFSDDATAAAAKTASEPSSETSTEPVPVHDEPMTAPMAASMHHTAEPGSETADATAPVDSATGAASIPSMVEPEQPAALPPVDAPEHAEQPADNATAAASEPTAPATDAAHELSTADIIARTTTEEQPTHSAAANDAQQLQQAEEISAHSEQLSDVKDHVGTAAPTPVESTGAETATSEPVVNTDSAVVPAPTTVTMPSSTPPPRSATPSFQLSSALESASADGKKYLDILESDKKRFPICYRDMKSLLRSCAQMNPANEKMRIAILITNCHLAKSGLPYYPCSASEDVTTCMNVIARDTLAFNTLTTFSTHVDNVW